MLIIANAIIMSTILGERDWNGKAQSLRRARAAKQGKKSNSKSGGEILKKAKALEKAGNVGNRSLQARFEPVPPLRPKLNAYERAADEDSWGEASEDSDDGNYYTAAPNYRQSKHNPKTYPLPPMSFALVPVQHPGALGYKTTPPKHAKHKDYLRRKSKPVYHFPPRHDAGVDADTQTDLDAYSPSAAPPVWQSFQYSPVPTFNQHHQGSDPRYQYIYVEHKAPPIEDQRLANEAASAFNTDRRFAESFTDDFISRQLQEEIIPDVLIEALDEMYQQKPNYHQPNARHRSHIIEPARPVKQPSTSQPRLNYGKTSQERTLIGQADVSRDVMEDLVSDYVQQQVSAIVRETCSEFVKNYVRKDNSHSTFDRLTDQLTAEACRSMFEEVVSETLHESLLDEHVTKPAVEDLLVELADDVLQQREVKQKSSEYEELSEEADVRFTDGVMLDYLLEQILRQERIHVDSSPSANFLADGMVLDVLLRRHTEIENSKSKLLDVKPVKRYHERVVTDVVMDLLLNELCLHLDEDMKDFDEYESGLAEYPLTRKQGSTPLIRDGSPLT